MPVASGGGRVRQTKIGVEFHARLNSPEYGTPPLAFCVLPP